MYLYKRMLIISISMCIDLQKTVCSEISIAFLLRVCLGYYLAILFKTKKQFQRIFDNPPAKYLSSKEFLEGIDYISSYLPKSEEVQQISASKERKTLYGPFSWMGFNCLKAKKSLRRQFTCHHLVPSSTWNSFHKSPKDGTLSQPWSH